MHPPALHPGSLVLTAAQMRAAEQRATLEGISGWQMMYGAGTRAAQEIMRRFAAQPVLVLAGAGNNGGDGFVIAEALRRAGWPVHLACPAPAALLNGDAATAAAQYHGEMLPFSSYDIHPGVLIVDALFGTGLDRALTGDALHILATVDTLGCPVVAVDIPSGVHSDSGAVLGAAAHALLTLTFAARKPAHFLYPGRGYCGEVVTLDIGIAAQVMEIIARRRREDRLIHANEPSLWRDALHYPRPEQHKYARGSALVAGGGIAGTGAARLAALSALRAGAGVVTVACDRESLPVYAAQLTSVMTRVAGNAEEFAALLADPRCSAVLVGPGHGADARTEDYVLAALERRIPTVLDADALTCFAGKAERLEARIGAPAVLTPHEGEFARLFPELKGDKISRAHAAARRSNAVVLLKGADTVIASPEGIVALNANAPPALATAGSGDVLAGIVTGLLATGMPAFDAACAAAWIHGEAGRLGGFGLIAEDLPARIPEALAGLFVTR
jgi:NAD(P)H-hydrate epimerase